MFQSRFSKLLCPPYDNQVQLTPEMRALGNSEEEGLKKGSAKSGGTPTMHMAPFTAHYTQLPGAGECEWPQERSEKRLQHP